MGRKIAKPEKVDYYVYIGPTIRSAVQQNAIITGSREVVIKKLAGAIEKYPPIAQLLVSGEELAEARKQIKQPGNRLYEVYKRLIGLLKTNGG
ncbi:MAG: hypothetical protein IJT77_06505 [Clostridia bacterium]|nr:hypothetical protein [Clostridia bacterium]